MTGIAPDDEDHGHNGALMSDRIVVYTDGACSGNPGPGGWGWAVAPDGEPSGSGGEQRTTNQRMEIHAVLDALRVLGDEPIAIRPVRSVVRVTKN